MAKQSMINREEKRAKTVAKYAKVRAELKAIAEEPEQDRRHLRVLPEQRHEWLAIEGQRLRRLQRDDAGRARAAVEQRQFPEEIARVEEPDRHLAPLRRRQDELDQPTCDDVQGHAGIVAVEDRRPGPILPGADALRQPGEVVVRQDRQERDAA